MTLLDATSLHFIFIVVLCSQKCFSANHEYYNDWGYRDTEAWSYNFPTCQGHRQSPINLTVNSAFVSTPIKPLKFQNYDTNLFDTLELRNDGHSVEMIIPGVVQGGHPILSGGMLTSDYEAMSVHFHWGSSRIRGSEHSINGEFYDVEVHLLHRNVKYASAKEAMEHDDGLAILAFFLQIGEDQQTHGYDEIFRKMSEISKCNTKVSLELPITLRSLLPSNTQQFFAYQGSLTSPPCSEVVYWHVLTHPLKMNRSKVQHFWQLNDENHNAILNNYRPTQPHNTHKVFYMKD